MANRTDPSAKTIKGTNPQNLIEKILRLRIYSNSYWKEHCFGLTASTIVDKAMELTEIGGTYGGTKKPTKFMCLVLKLLQIQPEKEIIVEFIKNEDYRYVRLLGAFYMRLVGKPVDVYQYLEPLYNDYRTIRYKLDHGHKKSHVDEFVQSLLTQDYSCDIVLPRLPKRCMLESVGLLERRISALEDDLEDPDQPQVEIPAPTSTTKPVEPTSEKPKETHAGDTREKSRGSDKTTDRETRDGDRARGERHHEHEGERERGHEREKDKGRDRERDRERDHSHDRTSERDRDRQRQRESSRERDHRHRESSRERHSGRGEGRERERERERGKRKDSSRERIKESRGSSTTKSTDGSSHPGITKAEEEPVPRKREHSRDKD